MSSAHQRTVHFQDSSQSVLTRFSSVTDHRSPITDHQLLVDHLVDGFISQASDWKTLTALTLGGMAYRWGKAAVITRVGAIHELPLQVLAVSAGLGSEVTAFEFTNRFIQTVGATHASPLHRSSNLWSWSGPGGWKEALLSDLIAFGLLKGAGYLSRESNLVTQHLFSSTAMVAGQNAASLFGITPRLESPLSEQWIHAEAMNLQMGAGINLVHDLSPNLFFLERGLELSFQSKVEAGIIPPLGDIQSRAGGSPPLQIVVAGSFPSPLAVSGVVEKSMSRLPSADALESHPRMQISLMVKKGEGGSKPSETRTAKEKEALRRQLEMAYGRDLLKAVESPILAEEVLQAAVEIPPRLEKGPKNLLSGLMHLQEKDPAQIHLTAQAVAEIFNRNALHTSRGSYQDALTQLFLESALSDSDSGQRLFALRYLHQALKKGIDIRNLEDRLDQFGYAEPYGLNASVLERFQNELAFLTPSPERLALYPKSLLRRAFDYAMVSKVPLLIVKRIAMVVTEGDHLSKLEELRLYPPNDRGEQIYRHSQSAPLEVVAQKIKGTYHTAFIDDPNLAREVASIRRTEYQWRALDPGRIQKSREILEAAITDLLESMGSRGAALKPERLLELLQCNSERLSSEEDASASIARDFEEKNFEIIMVSKKEFLADPDFDPSRSPFSLIRGGTGLNAIPQIVIRELPELDLESEKGIWEAFNALNSRLSALVFEWTLLKHDSSPALISRMIAHLETQRWRLINGLPMEWDLADRFGGMIYYLRGWVESH